jgi:hypothetical protein
MTYAAATRSAWTGPVLATDVHPQAEPTYRLEPTHNQRTTALVDALLLLRVERKWRALNRRNSHNACPEITRYRTAVRVLEADLLRAITSADECPAGASEATDVDPERTALLDDRAMAWRLARDLGFTLPRPSRPLLVKLRSERDFLANYLAGCRLLSLDERLEIAAAVDRLTVAVELLERAEHVGAAQCPC